MFKSKVHSCLLGGMLGDAMGGVYETASWQPSVISGPIRLSKVSDDTLLTLATCASLCAKATIDPSHIAATFLDWYMRGRFSGLGSSTLKALRDLQFGTPWHSAGATGERSAGNGAAMRIAPIAFLLNPNDPQSLSIIRDVCSITHKHDESFVAALAVVEAIWYLLGGGVPASMLSFIATRLPDTVVRDRITSLSQLDRASIQDAARMFGASGYAAESIPFSLFAAAKIDDHNFNSILEQIVRVGGDTDTNASIAGQLAGVAVCIPEASMHQLSKLSEFLILSPLIENFAQLCHTDVSVG